MQHCDAGRWGAGTPLLDMDRAVLLSDGEAAALSIEEAAEESESFMHGNLSHVSALGQVHHIQDHAPKSAAFVRQKALAVAAITGVLLDPRRRCPTLSLRCPCRANGRHTHAAGLQR